jgi:hypothetical protein
MLLGAVSQALFADYYKQSRSIILLETPLEKC